MKLKTIVLISAILAVKSLQLAQASDLVIGGTPVSADSPVARSTVALIIGPALCTGSIIASDLIVTAAHCLEGNPSSVAIVFSRQLNSSAADSAVLATRYLIHPDYRMNQTNPDQDDIALIEFHGGLPAGYAPNHLLPNDQPLKDGQSVVLAGYGITKAQTQQGVGTLRQTTVKIADNRYGSTEILLSQEHGHGACHGDSGGPAYVVHGGTYFLWGVTSRAYPLSAPDDCAHESVYTKIPDQMQFIREAAQRLRQS